MKRLVKPEYGGPYFTVTPKRWWSRKDRKAARLAAAVANHQARQVYGGPSA